MLAHVRQHGCRTPKDHCFCASLYGGDRLEEVLHAHTARGATPQNTGRLARLLLDAADRGDPTARRIVLDHGQALGDYALVGARQVGIVDAPFTLVLAGGVLRHPMRLLAETLTERVRAADHKMYPRS